MYLWCFGVAPPFNQENTSVCITWAESTSSRVRWRWLSFICCCCSQDNPLLSMLSELIDPFCDPTLPELCIRLLVDDVCKHNTCGYTVRHQVLYMNNMQHMLTTYDQTGNSKVMHCGIPINMSIAIAIIVVIYLVFGGRKPQLPTIVWSYVSSRAWLLYIHHMPEILTFLCITVYQSIPNIILVFIKL